jgi:hypothetical protein
MRRDTFPIVDAGWGTVACEFREGFPLVEKVSPALHGAG